MAVALLILLAFGLVVTRRLFYITRNYIKARRLGLPIIIVLFSWEDFWFGLLRIHLQWIKHLPFGLGDWIDFSHIGWPAQLSFRAHERYGPIFVVVGAHSNQIWTDDPQVCSDLMIKWKTWTRPTKFYSILEIFGENVLTDPGDNWQRQRKIINSAFNEQSNEVVWNAAIKQSSQMLDVAFAAEKQNTLYQIKAAVDTLTMHVLASGVFGQDLDYQAGRQVVATGRQHSFAETQRWILQRLGFVVLFGWMKFPPFIQKLLPTGVAEVRPMMDEYRGHLADVINEVRNQSQQDARTDNILSTMLQSNSEAKEEKLVSEGRRMYLTEEELFGNLFIMNMAGFETTASSISFSIQFLASQPSTQDWVLEEVSSLQQLDGDMTYKEVYDRSVRVMALMYETLRLVGALQFTVRESSEDQIIHVAGRDVLIPADSYLSANFTSVFQNPRYWGPDSTEWRPQRWIEVDAASGKELLRDAPSSTCFMPWTQGPRICPGKKFSQVEFVAAMFTILKSYRVEVVSEPDESPELARQRLAKLLSEIEPRVVPVLRNPHDAKLKFVRHS